MFATITGYRVGEFVHVAAVVVAFGATYAYAFFIAAAERLNPSALPTVLRGLLNSDRYLVQPGMVVILAAGIYLLSKGDISASETYVTVGFVAILALFGLSHAFFRPQTTRAMEMAERDLAAGATLSDEYLALSKRIAQVGQLAGLIVIVTVFFMVVKP
jgi:uncharacterized membrane protein